MARVTTRALDTSSRTLVQQLIDRLLADPDLRAEFARDPLAVARRLGVAVDEPDPSRITNRPGAREPARDGV